MDSFSTVIVDVDSTLSGIEGIDWLAHRRSPEIARRVSQLTSEAMSGKRMLSDVFAGRLELVRPTQNDVTQLADAYWVHVAPDARVVLGKLMSRGIQVEIVSSGYRDAILPFARRLGVPEKHVHSVGLKFTAAGDYAGYDTSSVLVSDWGKRLLAESLRLPRPVLAVGDGITDAEMRPAATAFAAYTGFVRRESVVNTADFVLTSFADLERIALGGPDSK